MQITSCFASILTRFKIFITVLIYRIDLKYKYSNIGAVCYSSLVYGAFQIVDEIVII